MAGTPIRRARREAKGIVTTPKPRSPAGPPEKTRQLKPTPKRGPTRPRFQAASTDDYALIEAGIDRAAAAMARAQNAAGPAERAELLEKYGIQATGRSAAADKRLITAAARVQRDQAIIAMWALSYSNATIATRFDLTVHHVRQIIQAYRQRRAATPLPESATILRDALDWIEGQQEVLAALIDRCTPADGTVTPGSSEAVIGGSAIVGAVRTGREMLVMRLELLQLMGAVSPSPSSDARVARARDLVMTMLDALAADGVDPAIIKRAAARALGDEMPELVEGDVS